MGRGEGFERRVGEEPIPGKRGGQGHMCVEDFFYTCLQSVQVLRRTFPLLARHSTVLLCCDPDGLAQVSKQPKCPKVFWREC